MTHLNNTYIIQNKPIKELLDNIDSFITNIDKFRNKYKNYSYNIIIEKEKLKELWKAEITIKYEKQTDNKISERVS